MTVKHWRRLALAAYSVAGVALSLSAYAIATTQSNLNAIDAATARMDRLERVQNAAVDNALSAEKVR
jgi:hypothetical protein